jgi:thiamine biosynthesis lipoprotein
MGAAMMPVLGCKRKTDAGEYRESGVYHWSGIGFGIGMSMEIHGVDEAAGEKLADHCRGIIASLEQAFSLYLEDSELSRLNRERALENPSDDFLDLLDRALALEKRTLGYYQPAIHGAWRWLQDHEFKIHDEAAWRDQCAAASARYLERGEDGSLRLTNPLTRLSMNAIGQGHLADRVAAVIRRAGVSSALLHLGETVGIGTHPSGRPWKLAVTGTGADADLIGEMELEDAGLAVSANEEGRLLIDPVDGCLQRHDRVAAVVSASGAAVADAFATAFAVAPPGRWPELAANLRDDGPATVRVWQANRLAFRV